MKAQDLNLMDPETVTEEYLEVYTENADNNDLYYLSLKYGTLETITDDLTTFMAAVNVALSNYAYKWEKLYETTQLTYNPIWNVDGTTEEERVIAARHSEDDIAARHMEDTIAARHSEDTIGGADVTTTNGAAPYDSSTFHNSSESHTVSLEHVDKHDADGYTDEHDTDAYLDKHDEDGYTDTITTTRTGNIGVTSTQSMIMEERRVADINMLDIIMADIINFVTIPYFGGI